MRVTPKFALGELRLLYLALTSPYRGYVEFLFRRIFVMHLKIVRGTAHHTCSSQISYDLGTPDHSTGVLIIFTLLPEVGHLSCRPDSNWGGQICSLEDNLSPTATQIKHSSVVLQGSHIRE